MKELIIGNSIRMAMAHSQSIKVVTAAIQDIFLFLIQVM